MNLDDGRTHHLQAAYRDGTLRGAWADGRRVPLHIDADLITNVEGDKRALRRTVKAARKAMAEELDVD